MLVVTRGAVVGKTLRVHDHPNGQRIWLAQVDLGDGGPPVEIVFGGQYKVQPNDLVPVAPPGAQVTVLNGTAVPRTKKMRARRFRGKRSHGMLCSLDELGWLVDGPDEVAILRGLRPGDSLDGIPPERRARLVARPDCLRVAEADTFVFPVATSMPSRPRRSRPSMRQSVTR